MCCFLSFTGLDMIATMASGQCLAAAAAKSRTILAFVLKRSSRVIPEIYKIDGVKILKIRIDQRLAALCYNSKTKQNTFQFLDLNISQT